MSYDLFFYKRKQADLTTEKISAYLTSNLKSTSGSNTQWFVDDEETETYFSIDYNAPDGESEEPLENIADFDNTYFTFNLNYLRPDFFGQEAFSFIDKFIEDLDLLVYNPQDFGSPDLPTRPEKKSLYKNWSELNARNSAHFFNEYNLVYLPRDKSDYIYGYRKNRQRLQDELGDSYYVSKLYTFITKTDNRVFTLALLPEETAVVIPKADFYSVTKKYKKLFKTVEEMGLMSYEKVMQSFGQLFQPFDYPDCKILNPEAVNEAQKKYNQTPFDHNKLQDFAVRADIQKLVNIQPNGQ